MTTDYANIINGVMWVQVVLAILLIGLRMYTRYYVMHSTGWDDIIMLVNLVDIFWHFFIALVPLTMSAGLLCRLRSMHFRRR